MKLLTISADACTETLVLLIMMAWADGKLEDSEKEGVRAAASVFNLSKELRGRLETLLEHPLSVDELLVESLTPAERAFAFVAARWVAGVDEELDTKEQALLDKVGDMFELSAERRQELFAIARDLPPRREGDTKWAEEIEALFTAIPGRLKHAEREGGADGPDSEDLEGGQ